MGDWNMDKETALNKLQTVYNAIDKRIDGYVDYIDNGRQWQEAIDSNKAYKAKADKIYKLIKAVETTTNKENIEIRIKQNTETRRYGRYEYTFNSYKLIVDGVVLLEV